MTNHHPDARTWADVVQSGGISVQIVLGNSNLGQATPVRMTGERGERRGVSRITNDMLLGAIAASTGLWVIGITVTISYLVITA
jgi:hypothetical protein